MKDICIIEKQLKDLDINDRFFDSLKNEYKDFIIWFNNHLDRKAYITFQDNKIASILILKIEDKSENYKDFNKEFISEKNLLKSSQQDPDVSTITATFIFSVLLD